MNHGLPDGCEGEKACRAASPCPYGRTEALHCRIVIAIHLLQASHVKMRYLNSGQNLCNLQINVMFYYCMINVFQVVAC